MSRLKLVVLSSLLVLVVAVPLYAGSTASLPAGVAPRLRTPDGRLHGLGVLRTPSDVFARSRQYHPPVRPMIVLPDSVDWSAQMPPVGDQGLQGSSTAWATTYYAKSYYEGVENAWSLATTNHQYSPAWTYNQTNFGVDFGSAIPDALWLLSAKGATSLAQQPYNAADAGTWPTLTQVLQAMPARNNTYAFIFASTGGGAATREAMKALLADGHPIIMSIPVYSDFNTQIAAPFYIYDEPGLGATFVSDQTVCVVGYSNTIGGIGGFKIRNSWGTSWGNAGSAYLSYNFTDNFASEAWAATDRIGYVPQAWCKVILSHTFRGDLRINLGHGSVAIPDWQTLVYDRQGGSGNDLSTYVDVTDQGGVIGDWWVKVEDLAGLDTGMLVTFSLIKGASELVSTETPLAITDFSTVVAHLSWALGDFLLQVVTAPGGTPTSDTNFVTVNYTAGGAPASAQVWDGHDVAVLADAGQFTFAATSSASGATERWAYGGVVVGPAAVRPAAAGTLVSATYYDQLKKLFATSTQTAGPLSVSNYVLVSYQSGGGGGAAHAYDGLPGTFAVWADRGSAYSYAVTSSASNATERWSSPSAVAATVLTTDPVLGQFWHQYKPTLTLNGTDVSHTTALLERARFGAQELGGETHAQWTDWTDAGTQLRLRDTTTGSPTRRTIDPTTWAANSAFAATCNFQSYYAISGRARDTANNPLAGVIVHLGAQQMTTLADGLWRFENLTAGSYTVSASKLGWHFSPNSPVIAVNAGTGDVGDQVFTGTEVPALIAWSPEGSGVLPTEPIHLTFSQRMNRNTTMPAFSLQLTYGSTGNVPGAFEWNATNTELWFRPFSRLSPYRSYKVHLGQTATSLHGAPLATPFEWTFQTADALTLKGWSPKGTDNSLLPKIYIEFDRDVDQASISAAFSVAPGVTGTMTFPNPHLAQFAVTTPLSLVTQYTVTLAASAQGLDGVDLLVPFSWHFTTAGLGSVVSATPTGTGVGPNAPVVVTYAQAMLRQPAQDALSVTSAGHPPVTGSFEWNAANTVMTFRPSHWLMSSTLYAINVAATALTQKSAPITPFGGSFTTANALQVSSYEPSGTAATVAGPIAVTFDRPVNPASLILGIVPATAGTISWPSDTQARFMPSAPLPQNTNFTVTVSGVEALDLTTLPGPFTWTFRTHGAVRVLAYKPRGGGVEPQGCVLIVFDQPMNPASFAGNFEVWMERPVRQQITGSLVFNDGGKRLVFTPGHRWQSFADYRVTLQKTVQSVDGVGLTTKLEWMFQTAECMQFTSFSPRGNGVGVGERIVVTFDMDVDQPSFAAGFSITPAVPGTIVWDTPRQVSYVPNAPLTAGTAYTVRLAGAIHAVGAGPSLVSPFQWTFRTAGVAPVAIATAVAASQSSSGTVSISFSLTAAADVQAEIMNMAGRVIAVAGSAAQQPAGPNTILWSRRTLSGSRAPGGAYLVRLNVSGADGSQRSSLTPLQLR